MNLSNETSQRERSATDCIHRGIDRTSEALHNTAENAAASATRMAETAERSAEKLSQQREIVRAKTLSYANQHPMRAIVISLGVGFVLAKLFRSRSTAT